MIEVDCTKGSSSVLSRICGHGLAFSYSFFWLAAAAALFWPTWSSLLGRWRNMGGVYSHAFPLLFIAALILVWRWDRIEAERVRPKYYKLASAALIAAMSFWLVGLLGLVGIVHQLMAPIALWLFAYLLLGDAAIRQLWCSFLLLFLCIPVWDYLAPVLQQLSATASHFMLGPIGIPAYLDETTIHIPGGDIVVADACSGVGFLLSFVALGAVYCTINRIDKRGITLVLLSSMVFGIFSNWARIAALVLIAYYSEMKSPIVYHHTNFGWMLFFGWFIVAQFFWRYASVAEYAEPVVANAERKKALSPWVVLVAMSLAPAMYYFSELRNRSAEVDQPATANSWGASWTQQERSMPWLRQFESYDQLINLQSVTNPKLLVTIIHYDRQSQNKKLIGNDLNYFKEAGGWRVKSRQHRPDYLVDEVVLQKGDRRYLAWAQYSVNGYRTDRALVAKLRLLVVRLNGYQDSGLIVLSAACETSCDSERESMANTFREMNALYERMYSSAW